MGEFSAGLVERCLACEADRRDELELVVSADRNCQDWLTPPLLAALHTTASQARQRSRGGAPSSSSPKNSPFQFELRTLEND